MNWHEDYLSGVNPHDLRELLDYEEQEIVSGFLAAGSSSGTFPVNVETEFLSGDTQGLWLRLWRILQAENWTGSPTGVLRFKINGGVQQDYGELHQHDVSPGWSLYPIYVEVPPFSHWSVTFENQTDTGNDRPSLFTLSGFYFKPRVSLVGAPSRGGSLR